MGVKKVCAWCGKFLGGDAASTVVSHGICSACHAVECGRVGVRTRNVEVTPERNWS